MLSRFRNRYFFFLDLFFLALTPLLALALRVKLPWDANFNSGLIYYVIFSIPVKIIVFRIFGLYRRLWRYASVDAIFSIIWSVGIASVVITAIFLFAMGSGFLDVSLPRSIPIIDGLLTLLVVAGTRFKSAHDPISGRRRA